MSQRSDEVFLVTGAAGCIGAWTIALLAGRGDRVIATDVDPHNRRLSLLEGNVVARDVAAGITTHTVDVTDLDAVLHVLESEGVTRVIHLAALQVPFCRADPPAGARVNVVGTVNIFEAVRRMDGQVRGLCYASSIAVYGPARLYPPVVTEFDRPEPATLYGVFKQANEATAARFAADYGVPSVGLRPCVVYGPGRDQGLTSDPTKAMLAAAAGVPYRIGFGGVSTYQHARDAASLFIEVSLREPLTDALVFNVGGPAASMEEVVEAILAATPGAEGLISYADEPLPFPRRYDSTALDAFLPGLEYQSLDSGIAGSIRHFEELLVSGRIVAPHQ